MVNRPTYRTASADLLFLFAAAVPKFHQASVRAPVVHIADTAIGALYLPGKAAGIEALVCQCAKFFSPFHLLLHIIKNGFINDGRVCAFYIILRKLATVLLPVLCDRVCDKLLLQEQIARISNIRKDDLEIRIHPAATIPCSNALGGELPLRFQSRLPVKEVLENPPDDRRFLWHNNQFIPFPPVAIHPKTPVRNSIRHTLSGAPLHIIADGAAFFLGK